MDDLRSEVERLKEQMDELRAENKRLKNDLKTLKGSKKSSEDEKMSRRGFLKKLGVGAIGLGALTVSPAASRMRLTDNELLRDGSPAFLGLSGSHSMNSNLDMGNYSINNLSDPTNAQDAATRNWVNSNLFSGSHNDLTNISSGDHHARYTDSEAVSAIESQSDLSLNSPLYVAGPGSGTKSMIELIDPTASNYGGRLYFDDSTSEVRLVGLNDGTENIGLSVGRDNGNVNIPNQLTVSGNTVWHSGNDGSGSGLDADTLDGQNASELGGINASNFAFESGSYSAGTGGTKSITFTNTYENGATLVNTGINPGGFSDDPVGVWRSNWITDANGNITGVELRHDESGNGGGHTIYWDVMGVTI